MLTTLLRGSSKLWPTIIVITVCIFSMIYGLAVGYVIGVIQPFQVNFFMKIILSYGAGYLMGLISTFGVGYLTAVILAIGIVYITHYRATSKYNNDQFLCHRELY